MILQIASGHFGWNRIINSMPEMVEDPAGILIKIGQGAKPGDGGLLLSKKLKSIFRKSGSSKIRPAFSSKSSGALFN